MKVEDRNDNDSKVDSKVQDITDSISSKCHTHVIQQLRSIKNMSPSDIIDAYAACAQPLVANQIEESNKEIHEQASLRTEIARDWEDYTCADFDLPTTTPKRKQTWNYQGKEHEVGVLLDRDAAKVHYVKVSLLIVQSTNHCTPTYIINRTTDSLFHVVNLPNLSYRTSLLPKNAPPSKPPQHQNCTRPPLPMEPEAVISKNPERHCKPAYMFHGTRRRMVIRLRQYPDVSTPTSMTPLDIIFKRMVKRTLCPSNTLDED
mgnify:CR=1 FL=1